MTTGISTTSTPITIQPHNERAAAVWSSGGKHYDQISRGISDSIEHAVMRLNPRKGERILDLSTGTGWTSRLVARRGAVVTGVDIAADLLAAARAKAGEEGLKIDYQLGDAECLPFETGSFDAVISTCGVMFAAKQEAAAAELAQMFEVMKRYMPPPPTPAPRSPFEWGRTERISELLGHAFQLRFEKGISYYREPSAEAAWNTFSTGYGPTRTLANSLDAEKRAAFRDDFIAFHAAYPSELGICVRREYWLTYGVRL
jgi:SAM-dependent methyltransferase